MDERTTTIEVPETTAQTPMGLAVPPERHLFALSPINRRRWQNFKATSGAIGRSGSFWCCSC